MGGGCEAVALGGPGDFLILQAILRGRWKFNKSPSAFCDGPKGVR